MKPGAPDSGTWTRRSSAAATMSSGGMRLAALSRLIHDEPEMPQVVVVEFERDSQSHIRMVLLAEASVPVL